jgi:PAS domain S-box-containing protein
LVGAALIENSRNTLRAQILEGNLAAADLAAQFAANYVEGVETNVRQFATRPLFRRAVFDGDVAAAEAHLAQFLQIDTRFDNVVVYDTKGIGWASGLMAAWQYRGGSVADREWFQQTVALRQPYLGIPVLSRGTGRPVITYAVPLMDDQGVMRAVLAGGISLVALADAITNVRISASASSGLLDSRQGGIILAHPDKERILAPALEWNAAAAHALAGEHGTVETHSSRSEIYLAAFAPVPRLPWAVLILEPSQTVFASVNALTQRALGLTAIIMLIAAIMGGLLARTTIYPVRQLVEGVGEIGKGNLDHRIPVRSGDEIGQLAHAFNAMAMNLSQAQQETAHNQRMLLALSQAAQEVQRARTPEQVYATVGDEVVKLGHHVVILRLTADRSHLSVAHHTFASHTLVMAEELAGVSAREYDILPPPDGFYDRVLRERHTLYLPSLLDPLIETLPAAARPLASQILTVLGVERGIGTPLVIDGDVAGILEVLGTDLAEADTSAITVFANQIAITLENVRLSQEARAWAAELERRVDARAAELRETRDYLENLLSHANAPIIVWDAQRRITRFNHAFEQLTGYAAPAVVGHDFSLLFPADSSESSLAKIAAALGGEHWEAVEIPIQCRDDQVRLVLWNSANVYAQDGRTLVATIAQGQDITDRKHAEEELHRLNDDLRRSNQELEQFAYVASHDLQEPLRMVASYTQLLAERYSGQLDEKADKYIDYAVDGARRMQGLINDLLAYSRVGTRGKEFAAVACSDVVAEVLRTLDRAIAESRADVRVGALPIVGADRIQLGQLFQNLIENAIKFRGDAQPRIDILATRDGPHWVFEVKDNGIGIDPQYYERIFIIFQRLHGRSEYPGSGIGLAIAKKIVERHGGRIWVEPAPGGGTRFLFTWPAYQDAARRNDG